MVMVTFTGWRKKVGPSCAQFLYEGVLLFCATLYIEVSFCIFACMYYYLQINIEIKLYILDFDESWKIIFITTTLTIDTWP